MFHKIIIWNHNTTKMSSDKTSPTLSTPEHIKTMVYEHLSAGGSLSYLAHKHKVEEEKKHIREYGNILKDSFKTVESYLMMVNQRFPYPDSATTYPEMKNALTALNMGSQDDVIKEIWSMIRPYTPNK